MMHGGNRLSSFPRSPSYGRDQCRREGRTIAQSSMWPRSNRTAAHVLASMERPAHPPILDECPAIHSKGVVSISMKPMAVRKRTHFDALFAPLFPIVRKSDEVLGASELLCSGSSLQDDGARTRDLCRDSSGTNI